MTFAELIDRLRELGVRDEEEISDITLMWGVGASIEIARDERGAVSIWHDYDGESR